jgi:hypothetical protein
VPKGDYNERIFFDPEVERVSSAPEEHPAYVAVPYGPA